MASSTWRRTFWAAGLSVLTTALESYAVQQRYFAQLLDPDDEQLDHARRILYKQAQDADDLSKRLDVAFTNSPRPRRVVHEKVRWPLVYCRAHSPAL